MRQFLVGVVFSVVAAGQTSAALVITEVMSSSGGTGTPDWFELTNTGAASADITGYKIDDNSNLVANAQSLLGVTTIAPGESAVFVETDAPASVLPVFRSFWSASSLAGVQVGSYSGSGLGLSSNGDEVHVFDAGGAAVANAAFGSATSSTGISFGYNPLTATFGALSVDGQFGAFISVDPLHNVGSPGAIPEPATIGLGAIALAGLIACRRNR